MAWDATAICHNNPAYGGKGGGKQGDDYPAAPNIDHTQVRTGGRISTDLYGSVRLFTD